MATPQSRVAAQTAAANSAALTELHGALHGSSDKVFGISPQGNSSGISTVPQLESALAHPIEVVNVFVGWGETFPTTSVNAIVQAGAVPELSFEPWNYTKGVNQPAFSDSVIASGTYDAYLTQFAQGVAAWHGELLFRYAHEMNGNWYPWAASVNGNTPAAYIAAWRHVHQIFSNAGATNALWVWCPNAGGPTPVASVFPGASYVNVVGMDGYNWGTTSTTNGGWRSPSQIFSGLLSTVRSVGPGLPILLNETGSAEAGGSKATWLNQLFSFVEGQSGLAGVVYSNFGSLWPLTTSSSALAAAKVSLSTY
ncbi:MAG TPA: glycosyl hydrolase [Acidimicrobiales bacterium]